MINWLSDFENWKITIIILCFLCSIHQIYYQFRKLKMSEEKKVCLIDGSPVTADHREIDPKTGLQKGYIVLSPEERAKGFVRPVRDSYVHVACGTTTRMAMAIAETYARDPDFYTGTFCGGCRTHFPLDQFIWEGTNEQVGS